MFVAVQTSGAISQAIAKVIQKRETKCHVRQEIIICSYRGVGRKWTMT